MLITNGTVVAKMSIQNGQSPSFLWRENWGERSDNVKIALSLRRDKVK
jgi:hypothetical protein